MEILTRYVFILSFQIVVFAAFPSFLSAQIKTNITFSGNHNQNLKQLQTFKKENRKALKDVKGKKKLLMGEMENLSKQLESNPELKQQIARYEQAKQRVEKSRMVVDSAKMIKENLRDYSDSSTYNFEDMPLANNHTESLNNLKNISSEYSDKYDSLKTKSGDMVIKDSLNHDLYNQINLPGNYDEKSQEHLSQYQSYQEELKKLNSKHDSLSVAQILIKTKQFDRIEGYLQQKALGKEGSDLLAAQQGLESLNPASELPIDPNDMNSTDVIEQAQETGLEYFENHADKLEAAHKSMADLKKKYSSVPNSNDLSTARKIKSLEGVPLKNRLVLGGTLQVHAGDPVKVDFNPLLGYQFDKRFSVGIGGTYRTSFGNGESFIPSGDKSVFGGRVFSEYVFFKSFYLHGEFESLKTPVVTNATTDTSVKQWSNGLLVGIGKSYSFSKGLKGNVTLLYNLIHNDKSPYKKPLMVRFGVMLK